MRSQTLNRNRFSKKYSLEFLFGREIRIGNAEIHVVVCVTATVQPALGESYEFEFTSLQHLNKVNFLECQATLILFRLQHTIEYCLQESEAYVINFHGTLFGTNWKITADGVYLQFFADTFPVIVQRCMLVFDFQKVLAETVAFSFELCLTKKLCISL